MINIDELIKNSMKSRNKVELQAYQNLKAEIQKYKTAKNAKPYNEAAELEIISKYCRSLEDAIKQFSEAHRDDLAASYTSEWEVLIKLIPESATTSEIMLEIWEWAGEHDYLFQADQNPNNFQTPKIPKKEMGNVIKHLKSKFPTTDGRKISETVKKYLV